MDPTVLAAVNAAWPGTSVHAQFRRRVALELVHEDGVLGPHCCLAAKLTANLRAKYRKLVVEICSLCTPPDGSIRIKQLLARAPNLPNHVAGGAEDPIGGAFLYWKPGPSDVCVVLDLPALLTWHAGGNTSGPDTPPNGSIKSNTPPITQPHAARPGFFAAAQSNRQSWTRGGGVHIDLTGLVPRYGTPGADQLSPYCSTAEGNGGALLRPLHMSTGVTSLVDLAHMAFPGPSPASQLRRSLVGLLATASGEGEHAGLPKHTVPWRHIVPLVSASKAAAVFPSISTPVVFKAFLLHPASGGAFAATRIMRPADSANPASHVDCVSLSVTALRTASAAGMAAAIAAAWPGSMPVQQLKRAAAEVLSRARSPAGSFTLNSGPLGNELKARLPTQYACTRSAQGGLMPRLDESREGGFLLYVREDGKEGYLQLKLHALLREYPPDDGRDLGLSASAVPTAPPHARGQAHIDGDSASYDGISGQESHVYDIPTSTDSAGPLHPATTAVAASIGRAVPELDDTASSAYWTAGVDTMTQMGSTDPWYSAANPPPASAQDVSPGAALRHAGVEGGDQVSAAASAIVAVSAGHPGPASAPTATYVPLAQLTEPGTRWIRESEDFDAMLQHCYSVPSIGLAVYATSGKPVVAALYVPGCTVECGGVVDESGHQHTATWPPLVYLMDAAMVSAVQEEGHHLAAAAEAFRALLESPYVAKVVHGCQQVAGIIGLCGASTISPLLDTRVLLQAVTSMLPRLPDVPPRPPAFGAVGPLAAATMASLNVHVGALRDELAKTGLWSQRQDLLTALIARHSAALREDLFVSREWHSNPVSNETALVQAARHLPELWDALVYEAVPWVAMAAAANTTAAAVLRSSDRPTPTPPTAGAGTIAA